LENFLGQKKESMGEKSELGSHLQNKLQIIHLFRTLEKFSLRGKVAKFSLEKKIFCFLKKREKAKMIKPFTVKISE